MKLIKQGTALAIVLAAACAGGAHAQDDGERAEGGGPALDVIQITAQRREASVQDSSVAVSAITGENLEDDRIFSFEDLADSVTSLSFTALSPLDQEFNIRGITNTRLDSPSADQSVGIFVDEVYIGRSGLFNSDMFDIERVEVIRGPQGVLLGRNVVGGAINIITASPTFEESGAMSVSVGNYDEVVTRGHLNGPLTDTLAGRISFQSRNRSGFNHDILHDRELDNIESLQARAQLLYQPRGGDLTARLVLDYMNDESNGFHSVAINGPDPATQGPWSAARETIGQLRGRPLDLRESLPEHPRYAGDVNETTQALRREAWGATLDIDFDLGDFATFTSVTGYREGQAYNIYDQSGIGPDNGYGVIAPLLFSFPVNETEEISQFTQEFRLVSQPGDSAFDWILGAYLQHDNVKKYDRFWAEVPFPALVTLSGESHWFNAAQTESYAVFGQLGWQMTDTVRLVGGLRFTSDDKSGTVTGANVEGGDQFNPTDIVPVSPLDPSFVEGMSFTTDYGQSWEELTPQLTVEYAPTEDLFFYATWSRGYKGGGFEDDPANPAAAQAGYDPETVENIELGAKIDFLDRRARLNMAAFSMDYQDLQVTQTDDGCLCNITDNAADAEIFGAEFELTFAATERLTLWAGATVLETEYIDFVDGNGLDNSGNQLQRTPDYQFNAGGELVLDVGQYADALSIRANYTHQGEMYWAPDNFQYEEAYGLLNGRIAFAPRDANWSVSVWGRNITDEIYRTNVIAFFGDEVSRLGAPRTYGFEFGMEF